MLQGDLGHRVQPAAYLGGFDASSPFRERLHARGGEGCELQWLESFVCLGVCKSVGIKARLCTGTVPSSAGLLGCQQAQTHSCSPQSWVTEELIIFGQVCLRHSPLGS